jgi:two-component system, OmpR family, sensor kinase
MWSMKRLQRWTNRIPIRWRLTLVSLGVLTLLLSALGLIILLTAEQALLSNEATALRNEARLAVGGFLDHPFVIVEPPGPPSGPLPSDFQIPAGILVRKLASGSANATVLTPGGSVIVTGSDLSLIPPVTLSPSLIQQTLANGSQGSNYLLARDAKNQRQLVVLMPLVSQHHTIAILQLSTPTQTVDEFITTLRFILLFGVIGALSLAIALTFLLVGAALRPLVDMERTSRRIAQGALSLRLDTPVTDDEIGHLALSFNQMVAQLEAAFKNQKQFVADVSHELRTPLTALSGSLEMLLIGADRGDIEASRGLTRNMYAEVQRMHRLVEDLLALTRLDAGKMVLREDTLNVRTVIDKVYDQAQQLAHGQEIRKEIAQDTPLVRADSDRLQQVLLNVVHNALKFTSTDGRVELMAYKEGQTAAIIEVRDTGKGIPPEALPHVFDRFYRADPARSRLPQSVSGNGLGLAIAKELIEAQGGSISISSSPGKGTTVTIRLRSIAATPAPQNI